MVALPFKSKQHKVKVFKRVAKAIPTSPDKEKIVLAELFNQLTPRSRNSIYTLPPPKRIGTTDETKLLVNNFYHDDFNSRVLPGKKDVLSVRKKNERE